MIGRRGHIKVATQAIRASKWRSLLTMSGVIIGVVSVVTTVSLGEGVKQQIRQQSNQRGNDLVTVLPGNRVDRDKNGKITEVHANLLNATTMNEVDYRKVNDTNGVGKIAPIAQVTGLAEVDGRRFQGQIIATSGYLPDLLNQKVAYGSFFGITRPDNDFAIIGPRVAENLFQENVPMGKTFTLRGQSFIVRGILDEVPSAGPLALDFDYNNAIIIPYESGQELMGGTMAIQQILVKPTSEVSAETVAARIRQQLLEHHAGQEDFTVLTQEETLLVAGSLLNMLTAMIAGIAAISLFVGGIGIMNIMFVSVTERTREIGIRKAVGATNKQILSQFLTEATILSLVGGLTGVVIAILLNFILRVTTNLQPVITLPIIAVAVVVSVIVGMIFGVVPAYRAARKDPIEALRYE